MKLYGHLLRKVAVLASADPRSVQKVLAGKKVAIMTTERIRNALQTLGLEHMIDEPAAEQEPHQ